MSEREYIVSLNRGGNNRYLYNPLNSSTQLRITS